MNKKIVIMMTATLSGLLSWGCQTTGGELAKKDPEKSVKVRTQMAAEYIRTGNLDAAKRSLDQALATDSKDSTANMMMGVLLQQEGSDINLERADHYFSRALSIDPKNAQARNNYGTYLYQVKRYDDAIRQLSVAGATLGYDQRHRALENLGRIYLIKGDIPNAEKSFKQALLANRDSTVSMIELAEIFYLQKNNIAARQLYEQFVLSVGQQNQGARALWIGLRIARANEDRSGMYVLVNQLRTLFPNSQEFQRYLQLQFNTEAVWK